MRAPRALPHPWSLWDPTADDDATQGVDAGGAALLAVEAGTELLARGGGARVAPGRTVQDARGTAWTLHRLGAPGDAVAAVDLVARGPSGDAPLSVPL
ncbi:MAG: hypothetical protein RI554_10715, partial [Trueperaceae bacterium]|nr:hypothetical protein [Trueperaceae bacterium]